MFIALPSDWLVAALYNSGLTIFEDVVKDAMSANPVAEPVANALAKPVADSAANPIANTAAEIPAIEIPAAAAAGTELGSEAALASLPWAWCVLLIVLTVWALAQDISVSKNKDAPHRAASGVAKPVFSVDINSSSVAELQALPEVGESLATRIVEYRQTHGPYHQLEELTRVRGVGVQTLEHLRPMLSLGEQPQGQPLDQPIVDDPPSLILSRQIDTTHQQR